MALQSAERVSQRDMSDNFVFQRSMLAYCKAAEMVSGNVLEIGTGSGYGVEVISPKAAAFVTIDKHLPPIDLSEYTNVEFRQMKVPPITGIDDGSMDYVITFQVVEHIKDDFGFIAEIHRILKPGGKLIISTPNRNMSITRNPWHIREYSIDEFKNMLGCTFTSVDALGVFGNAKIMEYYEKNRQSVRRITRLDILKLQYRLPRWVLRIPYDILNRINRRCLLSQNRALTCDISMRDYSIKKAEEGCFDLFYIATK